MKRVLLISVNREMNPPVFPLGMSYIHSSLRHAGYESGMLDLVHVPFGQAAIHGYLAEFAPDYVGLSVRNLDNCCMQRPRSYVELVRTVADWVRGWNPAVPIILGGAGFSLLPVSWMEASGGDYGIAGDGCESMIQLLRALDAGESPRAVPGLVFREQGRWQANPTDLSAQLDKPYLPERSGFVHPLDGERRVRHNVLTKRGCAFACTYCAYPNLEGREVRARSPQHIGEELARLSAVEGIREFDFVDSVFNFPLDHAEAVCQEILDRELDLAWGCFLHPLFFTASFASLLKRAGCVSVEFGVDSGSDRCLKSLGKQFGADDIRRAVELCREQELPFSVCLLFGGPDETLETVAETLALMDRLEIGEVFGLFGIRLLPNTEINDLYGESDPDRLLAPSFYLPEGLDLQEALALCGSYRERHPGWFFV